MIPPILIDNCNWFLIRWIDLIISLLNNASPYLTVPVKINFETSERTSSLEFCADDILKIIRSLDHKKGHGHDKISICIVNYLETEPFPKEWEKANTISVHKKGDKQLITNYRPVSFLPICGKVFEKIIFTSLFAHKNLLNSNQFGFRHGDLCVHQLISITHCIYKAFDENLLLDVRGDFPDLSQTFDKVWYVYLLFKLNRMGMCGK